MPELCPNCLTGRIVKNLCNGCGNKFGTVQSFFNSKKKKFVREKLPDKYERKKMEKAIEPLGFDPYSVSIKS